MWPLGGWFAGNQVLLSLLILWSLVWKGLALWKAAHRKEQWWFIAMLVINTAGLLEIFYLYVFTKKKATAHHEHHEGHEHHA